MFSITFKGRKNPQDPQMTKIEMVFYQFNNGSNRVTRVVGISGPLKNWCNKTQGFKSNSKESILRNQQLLELKNQYLAVAEQWDAEGRSFSTLQWADCFKKEKHEEAEQKRVRTLSVLQLIDERYEFFMGSEKFKNGRIISSPGNAQSYINLKNSLSEFTRTQYGTPLSRYFFTDIDRKFLLDYTLFIEKKGVENGNKGGLITKLRRLRALCRYADKIGIHGIDMTIFDCVHEKMRWGEFESKAVKQGTIRRIEHIDRSLLTRLEQFELDMFLFSFYAGGMANVDVVNLTWDMVKDNHLVFERTKFPKKAKPLLLEKASDIMEKYRGKGIDNFVFPVYTRKHTTDLKRMKRRKQFTGRVNATLKIACEILGIEEKITWYTARGSFISKMVDDGYSPYVVAEMAGNSTMVIFKHYYKNTKGGDMLKNLNDSFR